MTRTQVRALFTDIGLALDGLSKGQPGPSPIHDAYAAFSKALGCFDDGPSAMVRPHLAHSLQCALAAAAPPPVVTALEALLREIP